MVIGALGSLPFLCSSSYVLTFKDLSRELNSRWAKHEVLGKRPLLEYVGPDLMTVSMSIRFDTSLGTPPMVLLAKLKRMHENGMAKSLIIGGEYLGRYILESVSEERKFHTGAGVCMIAEASISLTEWAG